MNFIFYRWYLCRGELPPAPEVASWPGTWQVGILPVLPSGSAWIHIVLGSWIHHFGKLICRFGKLDAEPHSFGKLDLDPHRFGKLDSDPHGSASFWEAGSGSAWIRIVLGSWIRIRMDPHRFGKLDLDPYGSTSFWEAGSGSAWIRIVLGSWTRIRIALGSWIRIRIVSGSWIRICIRVKSRILIHTSKSKAGSGPASQWKLRSWGKLKNGAMKCRRRPL